MDLKQPAMAGTLESSDIQVTVVPNPGGGIAIELDRPVKAQVGDAIRDTVRAVLAEFGVEEARVQLLDQGALDCVIRARMQCAVCRAAQISYDWSREDRRP